MYCNSSNFLFVAPSRRFNNVVPAATRRRTAPASASAFLHQNTSTAIDRIIQYRRGASFNYTQRNLYEIVDYLKIKPIPALDSEAVNIPPFPSSSLPLNLTLGRNQFRNIIFPPLPRRILKSHSRHAHKLVSLCGVELLSFCF